MSFAKSVLFPKQPLGDEVWDWESDNFAWIDFFWSTLGRSGNAGEDVGMIYDMLQDEGAMRRLTGEIGQFVGNRGPRLTRGITKRLGRVVGSDLVGIVRGRERHRPDKVLSDAGVQGLRDYLVGPVALQFKRENRDRAAVADASFIFGHTHKPFERTLDVPGLPRPLSIYNSGGWVVDTPTVSTVQGASVLLIDAHCNVTALRMYNQSSSSADYKVRLSSTAGPDTNGLHARLNRDLDFDQSPWTHFSESAASEVALRHRLLPQIIQRGLTYMAD